jgi:periplasmic divalent cation tolerance protein
MTKSNKPAVGKSASYLSPSLSPSGRGRAGASASLVVLVTAPELKTARALARASLKARLVACVNLLPKIESHYRWQGKLETSAEILILFKTNSDRLAALEKLVLANHPYDTPEFIALPVTHANRRYLAWWNDNLSA